MNVLVIGSGGREHALAWKCAQSATVDKVFVAPGNAGTATEAKLENIAIDVMDFSALASFAQKEKIALSIVGPEAPLVEGIVDYFSERDLPCFGPSANAAQLEGSKAFTKDFLSRHGLAAGKGVIMAQSVEEALKTIEDMLSGNRFGEAGHRVVVEQFLEGEEASFIAMVDGKHVLPMATSQDHKARDEGDKGPNTGGMGAYSPAPVITTKVYRRIMDEVILPTVEGMAADGNDYTGFLYAGLMVSPSGHVNVVEFNCRFGDPEAQPVMLRLKSDLPDLCLAALEQTLNSHKTQWDSRYSVGVVLAAGGYPASYNKGDIIEGLGKTCGDHQKVFHAGTTLKNGAVVTNGGRVLCATALGDSVSAARAASYEIVHSISWANIYFRNDIAYRAIARENG